MHCVYVRIEFIEGKAMITWSQKGDRSPYFRLIENASKTLTLKRFKHNLFHNLKTWMEWLNCDFGFWD